MNHIVGKLALDVDLAQQADVKTPQQFAESPVLPKAFAKAVVEVRDETPAFIDNLLGNTALFAELSKALPAMLYEHFRSATPRS